jgi:hypothetical protein
MAKPKNPMPSEVSKSASKRAQKQAAREIVRSTKPAEMEPASTQGQGSGPLDRDAAEASRKARLQARMNIVNRSDRATGSYLLARRIMLVSDTTPP